MASSERDATMTDHNENRDEREQQLDAIIADDDCLSAAGEPRNIVDPAFGPTITSKAPSATNSGTGPVLRNFGEYEILEEIGVGGMGPVYKARHSKLRGILALKIIKFPELGSRFEVDRYGLQAWNASRLTHPGIVPVHTVGVHAGQHFYTMDYVAGGSLSKLCRGKPVHAKRAAELAKQLAETVHYAHGKGVLHRNLNPANVLLTTTGVPRITGFAFPEKMQAWTNSETLSRTQGRQISELVGYQSPEQALGESRLMGPATDVYSLGAVLYSLLTCRAPFAGDSPADTIIQLLKGDPVSPRTLNPNVPRDLELICLRCLNKEPHQRYVTAQMLAEDLSRFLEGRSNIPQPIGLLRRIVKWVRRHRMSNTHGRK